MIKTVRILFKKIAEKGRVLSSLDKAVMLVWQSSRLWMPAGILLTIIQGALPLAQLYLIKKIFDFLSVTGFQGTAAEKWAYIIQYIALSAFIALIEILLRTITSIVENHQAEEVSAYVTEILHAKSIEADLEYYENPSFFNALHRAQQSAPYRPMIIVRGIMGISQNIITLFALGGLFIMFHWALVLGLFLSVIPGFLVRMFFSEKLFQQYQRLTEEERKMSYLNWLLTGDLHAKELRLLNTGSYFKKRYASLRASIKKEKLTFSVRQSWGDFTGQVPAVMAVFIFLSFMIRYAIQGLLTIGSVVMYYQAFQRSQAAMKDLLSSFAVLYENTLFLSDFYSFLEMKSGISEPEDPVPFPSPINTGISFENVSFSYPGIKKPVLENITFSIRPGEHIALVGDNGAGKTTLIKLLCRLYDPVAGSISIDGFNIRSFTIAVLRRNISVLFQDYMKYNATVRENIWFGNIDFPQNHDCLEQAASLSGADKVVETLSEGYETQLGKMFNEGQELSIGQWQKISLARTFFRDAPIVILDEPTSSLDVKTEYEIVQRFHQLMKGKMAVIISHRFSTVKMADRIMVLEGGKIVESGSHDELMKIDGVYAKMFSMQSENYITT
ncbi:MAG: ABC transporter ATP-binding protein [Chlorobium sp.]|nr:MAG: ABC transporter ATP-binding protein [Chlorobium sp.]